MAMTKRSVKNSTAKPLGKSASNKPPKHVPTPGLYGWITHTEFASSNPAATKAWCAKVLDWKFQPEFPMAGGEYHLFAYSNTGGGGIRSLNPSEVPGSVAFVHVADAKASFKKAIRAGAEELMKPTRVMEGVTIAMVRAPGGVSIGFSGP